MLPGSEIESILTDKICKFNASPTLQLWCDVSIYMLSKVEILKAQIKFYRKLNYIRRQLVQTLFGVPWSHFINKYLAALTFQNRKVASILLYPAGPSIKYVAFFSIFLSTSLLCHIMSQFFSSLPSSKSQVKHIT